jgi:hypothetical protein
MGLPAQVFHHTAQWLHSKALRPQVPQGRSRSRISIKLSVKSFLPCLHVRGGAGPRTPACLTLVNGERSSENAFVLTRKRNSASPWISKLRVTASPLPPSAMDPNLRAQLNMSYAARYAPARYTRPTEARNYGHAPQTYTTQPQRAAVAKPSPPERYFDQRSASHLLRQIHDPFVSLGSCQVAHDGQCAFAR